MDYLNKLYETKDKYKDIIFQNKLTLEDDPNDIDAIINIEYYTEQLKFTEEEIDEIETKEYEAEMNELNNYYWDTRF